MVWWQVLIVVLATCAGTKAVGHFFETYRAVRSSEDWPESESVVFLGFAMFIVVLFVMVLAWVLR